MTLNMHLHNSSTSSKLPVMPLCHFKKQQKTAWRKLSDVLRAFSDRLFNELLCFMLNKSSQNMEHHITDLSPLAHNSILTSSVY